MSDFIDFKSEVLKADGSPVPLPINGTFFMCSAADQPFEMSFDGNVFFRFDQGLRLKNLTFRKLWFRATAGVDTNISFYTGSVEVDDSRLNIIHDANQVLSVGAKIPPTDMVCGNAVIAANGNQPIAGGNGGRQRKDIIVFNLDGALVLGVANGAGVIGGVIQPNDNVALETSDTVKILNQNGGAALAVAWIEIYYSL